MADERIAFTVHADMSGFQRSAAWMLAALNGTGEPRTRTHSINPETGEFTPLDFHREWMHVMDTQHPHTPQETDMDDRKNTTDQCQADPRTHSEKALDLIADRLRDVVLELRVGPIPDTLAEIRDRMPERVEAKVAPFDPDVIATNLEAIKHEAETPMRGHGECCDGSGDPAWDASESYNDDPEWSTKPAPADVDPDEAVGSVVDVTDLYARLVRALGDLARVTGERDEAAQVSRRHIEALAGLRYYYAHHTAESISPASVARRIQWRMDEVGIDRDDERAES